MVNSKKQKCSMCAVESQGLEEFDCKQWCPDCLEEKTGICEKCKNRFYESELISFDDKLWCEECLDGVTTICSDCGERFYLDDATYVNDDPICERCYDDNYFQCEACERRYHQDEYGGDGLCQHCSEDNVPSACPDNRRYYSKSHQDMPVGVEIEAEGGDCNDVYDDLANEGFGIQGDGSLSHDGIEIQVPASDGNHTEKLVRRACKSLEENGFDISKRCGLHIHIEYPCRMKTIKRLMLMIYACEPVFYAINPQSRKDNNYCRPLNSAFSVHEIVWTRSQDIDKLFYSKRYTGLTKSKIRYFRMSKWNECRYFGFNLHSLFHQRTIEFRHHAGTISPDKIMHWIGFLKAILLYVRFRYDQAEVLRLIEQPTILSKVRYLKNILRLDEHKTAYLINRYIKFHNICAG